MRFWTTDWSYNDFFNRLGDSPKFALAGLCKVGLIRGPRPSIPVLHYPCLLWLEVHFVPAVLHENHVSYRSSRLGILVDVRYLPSASRIVAPVARSFYVPYYCLPA